VAAGRWFNGLEEPIYTLERLPRRCLIAPESRKAKRRLRQLLYGAKRDVYRVIYEIDESRKVVCVLTIRHAAWTSSSAARENLRPARFLLEPVRSAKYLRLVSSWHEIDRYDPSFPA
jgi:mRNA-degrading endonuclease RelE of RelBE toxin-antitoxin system